MMPGEREAIFSVKAAGKISANYNVDLAAMLGVIEVAPAPVTTTAVTTDVTTFAQPQPRAELGGELGLTVEQIAASLGTTSKELRKRIISKGLVELVKSLGFQAETVVSTNQSNGLTFSDYVFDVHAAKFVVARHNNEIGAQYLAYLIRFDTRVTEAAQSAASPISNALQAMIDKSVNEALAKLPQQPITSPEDQRLRAKEALNKAVRAKCSNSNSRQNMFKYLSIHFGRSTTKFTVEEYEAAIRIVKGKK